MFNNAFYFYLHTQTVIDWENIMYDLLRRIFGLMCHQESSILITIDGRTIPLCPRCIGLHVGFLLSFIIMTFLFPQHVRLKNKQVQIIITITIAMAVGHWFIGQFTDLITGSYSRLVTGLLCGSALSTVLREYRWELKNLCKTSTQTVGIVHVSILMNTSLIAAFAFMSYAGYALINVVVFISVLVNAAIACHTFYLTMHFRLKPLIVCLFQNKP